MSTVISNIVDLFSFLEELPVKRLQYINTHIEKIIKDKTPADRLAVCNLNVNDYVSYDNDFVSENDAQPIIESLKSHPKFRVSPESSNTKTLWLSRTTEDYNWTSLKSGKVAKNKAVPFSDFPDIDKLLDSVNERLGSDLNSCLVCFYPSVKSGIRIHDDYEYNMDNEQPIAVVSFGTKRGIQFFHNYQAPTEKPLLELSPEDKSLYVMKAGCQELFRHKVPPASDCVGERFSLSFRRIVKANNTPRKLPPVPSAPRFDVTTPRAVPRTQLFTPSATPVSTQWSERIPSVPPLQLLNDSQFALMSTPEHGRFPISQPGNVAVQNRPCETQTTPPNLPIRKICLLLGTSMTKWVKPDLISDIYTEVINVSHSGARIKNRRSGHRVPDVGEMIENFASTNPEKVPRVNQVVVSVGTNDIMHYRKDNGRNCLATPGNMEVFSKPLQNVVRSLRYVFGKDVSICFQCVLPMKNIYTYTVENFLGFNNLLRELCYNMECKYLDWFGLFLDAEGHDINSHLFADNVHLNRNGYDLIHKCFKNVVDSDRFSYYYNKYNHFQ